MLKSSLIALATVATLAGIAAPAFAVPVPVVSEESSGTGVFGSGSAEHREWMADTILTRLQQQGVNATAVEEWGGLLRAFVIQPDGSQVMQLFAPDTLRPVAL